jgi:flavodoxin
MVVRILIAYFTQTNNTQKIAEAISEELTNQGHQVRMERLDAITPGFLDDFDIAFVGSACHDADLARPAKRFLEGLSPSPSYELAGFVTHATYTGDGGDRQQELYDAWAGKCIRTFQRVSQEKGIHFLGFFHCQGAPIPEIATFIHQTIVTDDDEWERYIAEVNKHPDEEDLRQAKDFARHVVSQSKHSAT